MPRLQPCDTAAGVCDESRSWLVVADPNNRQEAQGRLTDSMHVLDNGGQLSRAWALEWGDQSSGFEGEPGAIAPTAQARQETALAAECYTNELSWGKCTHELRGRADHRGRVLGPDTFAV